MMNKWLKGTLCLLFGITNLFAMQREVSKQELWQRQQRVQYGAPIPSIEERDAEREAFNAYIDQLEAAQRTGGVLPQPPTALQQQNDQPLKYPQTQLRGGVPEPEQQPGLSEAQRKEILGRIKTDLAPIEKELDSLRPRQEKVRETLRGFKGLSYSAKQQKLPSLEKNFAKFDRVVAEIFSRIYGKDFTVVDEATNIHTTTHTDGEFDRVKNQYETRELYNLDFVKKAFEDVREKMSSIQKRQAELAAQVGKKTNVVYVAPMTGGGNKFFTSGLKYIPASYIPGGAGFKTAEEMADTAVMKVAETAGWAVNKVGKLQVGKLVGKGFNINDAVNCVLASAPARMILETCLIGPATPEKDLKVRQLVMLLIVNQYNNYKAFTSPLGALNWATTRVLTGLIVGKKIGGVSIYLGQQLQGFMNQYAARGGKLWESIKAQGISMALGQITPTSWTDPFGPAKRTANIAGSAAKRTAQGVWSTVTAPVRGVKAVGKGVGALWKRLSGTK
jgi:hypothetical protein